MHVLSKGKAKFIRSLQHQKYRQKYHKIIVEGVKILNELITSNLVHIETICASAEWFNDNGGKVNPQTEQIQITQDELVSISSLKNPQDCLAIVCIPDNKASLKAPSETLCLYLDAVRDPGNLGTILRSADWFGYSSVFMSPDTVDIYNSKVIQSSMSSVFRPRHSYVDLETLLESNPGIPVYGALLGAPQFTPAIVEECGLIILGNESRGIMLHNQEFVTQPFSITEKFSLGAESLNVGVAAGIICALFRKV